MSASHYQVNGDRQGTVTVTDTQSGEVIRTFEMDAGVVVRETFLLEKGKIVAACQKDHAVFWDLETGEEIRRFPQRIYGFSHDERKFFTFEEKKVFLYTYPEMTQICQLSDQTYGPASFCFSPDDHFLAILFIFGLPSKDEYYPQPNPTRKRKGGTSLFNLQACQEIQEFTNFKARRLGQFSEDSKLYFINDTLLWTDAGHIRGNWIFDLFTHNLKLQSTC